MSEKLAMKEHLQEPQVQERMTIEMLILAQLDDCRRMYMLNEIEPFDPISKIPTNYFYCSVEAFIDLSLTFADEKFLEELDAVEKIEEKAKRGLKKMRDERHQDLPSGSMWQIDTVKIARMKYRACLRLIQRRGLALTMIGREKWSTPKV